MSQREREINKERKKEKRKTKKISNTDNINIKKQTDPNVVGDHVIIL